MVKMFFLATIVKPRMTMPKILGGTWKQNIGERKVCVFFIILINLLNIDIENVKSEAYASPAVSQGHQTHLKIISRPKLPLQSILTVNTPHQKKIIALLWRSGCKMTPRPRRWECTQARLHLATPRLTWYEIIIGGILKSFILIPT